MWRKILLIAKRDYVAAVRTKAFLFGLIAGPLLMGGSFLGIALMKYSPDVQTKRVAIVDRTGVAAQTLMQEMEKTNAHDRVDKNSGAQVMPKYQFEIVQPDLAHSDTQRLLLSDLVRNKKLSAFVEIGARSLTPDEHAVSESRINWYSNEGGFNESLRWFTNPLNRGLAKVRLAQIGITPERAELALKPVPVESVNLLARDPATGRIIDIGKKNELQDVLAPFIMPMLLFMITLGASAPMLGAVAEDKMQRVFEMLLAAATPYEIMAGKTIAATAIALTSATFYIVTAIALLEGFSVVGFARLELVPWFVVFLVAEVIMLTTISAALGAACSSPQEGEKLKILVLLPLMLPMFLMVPAIQQPNSLVMTVLSFVPAFTPILMLMRQATPGGIPVWQPWIGLAGVAVGAAVISWLASRVFRITILLQGQTPTPAQLIKWGLHG